MGRVETEGCFLRRGSSLAACAAANCGQWGNWRHALACPPQMWPTSFDELRGGTRGRLKFHNFRRTPPRAFLVSKPEVQRAVANLYRPTLEADVEDYFRTAPADELVSKTTVEKGHGRIETRTYAASSKVDWITSERSYPGQPRFKNIKTILKVHARAEYADRCSFETHYHISSAPLDIERIARGARGHWSVESMHWLLDVEFKDDLSRYRTGHGAKNMTIVRRFALGLVRANKAKGSVKTRRKTAGWSPDFLLEILQLK